MTSRVDFSYTSIETDFLYRFQAHLHWLHFLNPVSSDAFGKIVICAYIARCTMHIHSASNTHCWYCRVQMHYYKKTIHKVASHLTFKQNRRWHSGLLTDSLNKCWLCCIFKQCMKTYALNHIFLINWEYFWVEVSIDVII